VYSTLLWHLQRTVQLSFLAQELLSIEPRSSQAWIAIANTFSLQKECSQALTCFRRAQQLDPTCAYAFTLAGHEFIDEDLDKAILSRNLRGLGLPRNARHRCRPARGVIVERAVTLLIKLVRCWEGLIQSGSRYTLDLHKLGPYVPRSR
jgi:hypothetical protein